MTQLLLRSITVGAIKAFSDLRGGVKHSSRVCGWRPNDKPKTVYVFRN